MDYKKLFNYAIRTGEIMLRNGAETSRVEDTINRILSTSGFSTVESFVTPTGIFATLDEPSDPSVDMVTFVQRVHKRTVNLDKVALANDLSRKFCQGNISLDEAWDKLEWITLKAPYPPWLSNLGKGLGAGFLTVVYGGDYIDLMVALIIGILLGYIQMFLEKHGANKFLNDLIGGAFIAAMAILIVNFIGFGTHFDLIIIGAIMPLVPGVAITNAIRDTIQGDFISGVSRAADAFTVAAAVALGVGSVLRIYALYGGLL